MRCLLTLLTFSTFTVFAVEEYAVPLKPFRTEVRQTYKVAAGDTVYSIARRFGRDPKLIQWMNRLNDDAILSVGKVVFIGDASQRVE